MGDPTEPSALRLMEVLDATWPAAETQTEAGWLLRRGAGGGKRVSAASPLATCGTPNVAVATAALARWGQPALFRLSATDQAVDAVLAAEGFAILDPTVIYTAPVEQLTDTRDETARILRITTPLARAAEIWAEGGIGPGRLAVMERVTGPRVCLMARLSDRPVGVAFVAEDGGIAMLHAVEVLESERRLGAGLMLLHGAANWAASIGAVTLALAVTEANAPARALYEKLGMSVATRYHYRHLLA